VGEHSSRPTQAGPRIAPCITRGATEARFTYDGAGVTGGGAGSHVEENSSIPQAIEPVMGAAESVTRSPGATVVSNTWVGSWYLWSRSSYARCRTMCVTEDVPGLRTTTWGARSAR